MSRKVTVIPARPQQPFSDGENGLEKRVAAYCRVSTDQEEQLGSLSNQVEYYSNMISTTPGWTSAGIFADEGISGTGTKHRAEFQKLIKACEDGAVDLVITKSISRFARNTADCLTYCRKLKALGIPIIFEKEGINTLETTGELMFTILSSLAQEESRNISENCAWGIRSLFQKGVPHLNTECLLGYDKDEDGNLVINEEQAVVVRRIYRDYLEGWQASEIARHLNDERVLGVHGKVRWNPTTIERMLINEKHCGDLLMQKTYTGDYLTKRQVVNNGELEQYFIENDHPPIVGKEQWNAVQEEINNREQFCKEHSIKGLASAIDNPYYNKVYDSAGRRYVRVGLKRVVWKIADSTTLSDIGEEVESGEKIPTAEKMQDTRIITEASLKAAFRLAWNSLVVDRDKLLPVWKEKVETGTPLEKYYSRMAIDITADGPLGKECIELTRLMLREVTVLGNGLYKVSFKDGSERTVKVL